MPSLRSPGPRAVCVSGLCLLGRVSWPVYLARMSSLHSPGPRVVCVSGLCLLGGVSWPVYLARMSGLRSPVPYVRLAFSGPVCPACVLRACVSGPYVRLAFSGPVYPACVLWARMSGLRFPGPRAVCVSGLCVLGRVSWPLYLA